jgi:hypothetical protein
MARIELSFGASVLSSMLKDGFGWIGVKGMVRRIQLGGEKLLR